MITKNRDTTIISIRLDFAVEDPERLRTIAAERITEHGLGHEYDPDNLADCLIEALLHSNPNVEPYDQYGVELIFTGTNIH